MIPMLNPKETEYYCQVCKYFAVMTAINPKCEICNAELVVALRSIIDGSRITGNDELATADFRPTPGVRIP